MNAERQRRSGRCRRRLLRSLLKIEEELQEAIRQGQEDFEQKNPLFRVLEYSLSSETEEQTIANENTPARSWTGRMPFTSEGL